MLLCSSLMKKRHSFVWEVGFSFGEQEQTCYMAIVSDSSFVQMKQSIHLVNPWINGFHFVLLETDSVSGPWIYIPQTFWSNGIVLGPWGQCRMALRACWWLRCDGMCISHRLAWSSSFKSALTYDVVRNASQWPFMREVACRLRSLALKCDLLIFVRQRCL